MHSIASPAAVLALSVVGGASPAGHAVAPFAAVFAIALAAVHLLGGRLWTLDGVPRSWILSTAGGVSVAYVFVHVLPELERAGGTLGDQPLGLPFLEDHSYLLALLGLVAYYGLEQFVRRSREDDGPEPPSSGVFRLHVGSFALYNGLIGYLLFHRETPGVGNLFLFAVAMAFHLLVNDYGLHDHHERAYRGRGRWVLAGAVLAGAVTGWATAIAPELVAAAFALLAGGIVLNVIKEELPAERQSRFWPFALGAGGYAAVLLAL